MNWKTLPDLLRHREEMLPPDEQYRLLLQDIDGLYGQIKEVYNELKSCRPKDEFGNDEPINYNDIDYACCILRGLFACYSILYPMDESELIDLLESVRESLGDESPATCPAESNDRDSAGAFLPSGDAGV